MNNVDSYIEPYKVDTVITGNAVGQVVHSESEKYDIDDLVVGIMPWQEYALLDASDVDKIDVDDRISPSAYLGVLGLTGLTAYFGMLDIGQPQKGETVVVTAAAGAVGSVAGQIAKLSGCKVIGITGSDEKVTYLTEEIGFDQAINYKKTPNIRKILRQLCPEKVDIYFDNVGGDISDGVFYWLNNHSRIVLCGQIALYNLNRLSPGPRLYPQFIIHRVKMQGFIVYDYTDQFLIARKQLKEWFIDEKITVRENIVNGFEKIPEAFLGLFSGDNIGKQLVRV